ncbi:T9SS type A sorting domain-containing protein [Flavobacterium sp. 83]|uniref:T9SS type A sorting domain-containing protein n=1 Tax=Flavobacterium sp. 83 TaxID=1131812 RepID=UPI0005544FD1|nr:T9SS type A sorting domain-containing protein [Flavobacterium sp. 83]
MKKLVNLLLILFYFVGFSQQKSTGIVILTTDMTANLTLDNLTSKVALKITGPSDRWFGIHFGKFGFNEGMKAAEDIVYVNQNTIIDCNFAGGYTTPNVDVTNNWVVLSDTVNGSVRTIILQRNFLGDGVNDFNFNFSDTNIDFAWARGSGIAPAFQMGYHGESNWGYSLSNYFSTLGVEDFTLNASVIYPNPANDKFIIKTKSTLRKISIYSQVGVLVKTINVENNKASDLEVRGLQSGVYLIELQNENEKSWKKVMIIQ